MKTGWLLSVAAALVGSACIGFTANAGTLLSEDFSGVTPGGYNGAIPGSAFKVSTANVDVVGVLNGNFFTCTNNVAGNCLDLVGNTGAGGIASVPTFALTAGNTYTVNFGAILQGFAPGTGFTSFSVGLGTLSQTETINGTPQSLLLTFKPVVSEANAALSFTTIVPGDTVHGAVLDHINLTETAAVGGVPEPASWAMMLAGFGIIGGVMRRRAGTISVTA